MTGIRLTFPAGRYHATPWGRHVNEGVAEWPPSPYRLLRALYDVWQRKCFGLPEEAVRGVLAGLASAPPRFHLCAAVPAHTRSYLSANSKDPTAKNLVFDPFLVFDRPQACFLEWPELTLRPGERETLGMLLRNLNFLGRSESWVGAELWEGPVEGIECGVADGAHEDRETERVACPLPADEYAGKQPWMDALTFSTASLIKEKASSPPLLRPVRYHLPKDAIETDPARPPRPRESRVDAVLLSLDATVLPLVTTTIEVAEQVRVRLMGAHKRRVGGDESKVSPVFSGKGADGRKRLDHGHVYILPLGNKMGRIDRILIVSPLRPFAADELDAVRGIRELWQGDGRPSVACVMTWQGERGSGGPFEAAREVVSVTPFVSPRHRHKNTPVEQFVGEEVRRECRNHGIPAKIAGTELVPLGGLFDIVEYRRNRREDPVQQGFAIRIVFDGEVVAPFSIGYGAHFGLGQLAGRDSRAE